MTPRENGRRLQPLRRERLYESLAQHISDFIEAQGLTPGDRLPSERQLASELGVSRATLSRALAALETKGVIEVRHGVGALVRSGGTQTDPPDAAVPDSRSHPSAPLQTLDSRPRQEVLVAREAVLAGLARAAASDPRTTVKIALLGEDGRARRFDDTWVCIRRLAASPLLAELDDTLAAQAPPPADGPALAGRLDGIAQAILDNDPSAAALACQGLLDPVPVR